MNNSAKQKLINSVLYVALALIAVTIMCVSIFSFATAANKAKKPLPDTEQQTEAQKDTAKEKEKESTPKNDSGWYEEKDEKEKESETLKSNEPSSPSEPVSSDEVLFSMPVSGEISKEYSHDVAVYSLTMNDYRIHSGIDIGAQIGAPVCAAADGTVSNVYDSLFMGKCISIDHGNGIVSHYMGVSEEIPDDIFVGAKVSRGQTIAGIGETALLECADVPHLHFEISVNSSAVDPMEYLEPAADVMAESQYE